VLITNAEERAALAACRSLHAVGYEVSTIAFRTPFAASHWSRACAGRLCMTDPGDDANRFLEELERELRHRSYDVLLPGSDRALLAISRAGDRLEEFARIGLPSCAVVRRTLDRESMAQAAENAGLLAAESVACQGLDDALTAAERLGFPIILKSPEAASDGGHAVASLLRTMRVSSEEELIESITDVRQPFLLQRAAQGEVLSFGGVIAEGRLLGVAVSRYLRTWRPEAGNATFAETIAPPDGLAERVERLLGELGWQGIFELELIRTADGDLTPIDLNPRVYGSMTIAAAAGAPLAVLWCDWLLGRKSSPATARAGQRYRWEDGDLAHLGSQLRRRRYRAALAVVRPRRHVTHAQAQLADPLPFLARSLQLLRPRIRS
jgi:predicted ATP-grasp superfamily ATP-dependent carboligase